MPADTIVSPELLAAVTMSVREALDPPALVDHEGGQRLLGVSRSAWYRLLDEPGFPRPVALPGVGPRYKRAELLRWVERLGTRRRSRPRAEVTS